MPRDDRRRLLVVAPEMPWPLYHGARVDIWNRYLGLQRAGWTMALVAWTRPQGPVAPEMHGLFEAVWQLPLRRFTRLVRMARLPSQVAARHVDDAQFGQLLGQARHFEPDAVICESIQGYELARRLGAVLDVPVLIRSHNIEFRYMAGQFRLARTVWQGVQIAAARLHLRRYETAALRSAAAVLDISYGDVDFWRGRGVARVHWVPPAVPDVPALAGQAPEWAERRFDVGYLGNLWAPNNVAALTWLLDAVLPLLRRTRADITLVIAGAGAAPDFARRIAGTPNVTLVENPEDAMALRRRVRVLVNPILAGGGLNTKNIEMLYCASPIVVTPFALVGLPETLATAYDVAADAGAFAEGVLTRLDVPFVADAARLAAREWFGHRGVVALSEIVLQTIADHGRERSWR